MVYISFSTQMYIYLGKISVSKCVNCRLILSKILTSDKDVIWQIRTSTSAFRVGRPRI